MVNIWCVTPAGAGNKTGQGTNPSAPDWANAAPGANLQQVVENAGNSPGDNEVWVAAGNYTINQNLQNFGYTIFIPHGVKLLGGFKGNETDSNWDIPAGVHPNGRAPMNITCLLPDSAGNIITINDEAGITIDGFTIGPALQVSKNPQIGLNITGISSAPSSVYIAYCTFRNNNGGAISIGANCAANISNCIFQSNSAASGGAIYCNGGVMNSVYQSDFIQNSATTNGGAVYFSSAVTSPEIKNCAFAGNNTTGNGGAIYYACPNKGSMVNCVFAANQAAGDGGALYCFQDNAGNDLVLNILNCTFYANYASPETTKSNVGAGLYIYNNGSKEPGVNLINNIFFENYNGHTDFDDIGSNAGPFNYCAMYNNFLLQAGAPSLNGNITTCNGCVTIFPGAAPPVPNPSLNPNNILQIIGKLEGNTSSWGNHQVNCSALLPSPLLGPGCLSCPFSLSVPQTDFGGNPSIGDIGALQ